MNLNKSVTESYVAKISQQQYLPCWKDYFIISGVFMLDSLALCLDIPQVVWLVKNFHVSIF